DILYPISDIKYKTGAEICQGFSKNLPAKKTARFLSKTHKNPPQLCGGPVGSGENVSVPDDG
ncbi:MAG: hypothetical protein LIO51_06620, partial [Clostridiales bacterium]|nr:hypothetical protein [Clostridiales bacterium]